LKQAQAEKAKADMVASTVQAQYQAIQTAATVATTPAVAPLADSILKSAGFEDKDAPPIIPGAEAAIAGAANPGPEIPTPPGTPGVGRNTSPAFPPQPPSPAIGIGRGGETQATEDNLPV